MSLIFPIFDGSCRSYLATLSMSLYLFNLFCLPFLDGSLFFSALLDSIGGARKPNENMSPVELSDQSHRWLEEESEAEHLLDGDLESGSVEFSGRFSSPPLHGSSYRHGVHGVFRTVSYSVGRCRRMIRSRKHFIESVVRVGTIALIGFIIMGMVWTQQWKAVEA